MQGCHPDARVLAGCPTACLTDRNARRLFPDQGSPTCVWGCSRYGWCGLGAAWYVGGTDCCGCAPDPEVFNYKAGFRTDTDFYENRCMRAQAANDVPEYGWREWCSGAWQDSNLRLTFGAHGCACCTHDADRGDGGHNARAHPLTHANTLTECHVTWVTCVRVCGACERDCVCVCVLLYLKSRDDLAVCCCLSHHRRLRVHELCCRQVRA